MAKDYYEILGVSRSATSEEIQKGYRKEARKYHPDLHEDKDKAKQQFQKVQHAYEVLSDPEKRRMYDQMGPDFEKMGRGGHNPFGGAGGPGGPGGAHYDLNEIFGGGGGGGAAFEQLFRQFGGGMGGMPGGGRHPGQPQAPPAPKLDIEQAITIPFATAVLGGSYQVSVKRSTGKVEKIAVKIPAGIESGKKIRLRGLGHRGPGGRGDLLIKVGVSVHPCFSRAGNNLMAKLPVTLREAILGAKIDLPTPHGTITITVPAGSANGKSLRLKGMGIKPNGKTPGDLFAEIQVLIPKNLTEAEQKMLDKALSEIEEDNPRSDLIW